MEAELLVLIIYGAIIALTLLLVIFYLIKRIKDSKNEKFEKRDN